MCGDADRVRAQFGHKSLSARSIIRKSLILNGEMSEWSIEHAWKALRWNSVETYRIAFSAVVSTT